MATQLARPSIEELGSGGRLEVVRGIIEEVQNGGDEAILRLSERYDGVLPPRIRIEKEELAAAVGRTERVLLDALEKSADSIRLHHERQIKKNDEWERDGLTVRSVTVPVERVGCYIPGGRGAYPSTVLMTAIPARVAGVGEVAACVPPGPAGSVSDFTLAAAAIAEVDVVYPVGGAQAIAALTYGTESITSVDVVVGPGNAFVSLAKRELSGLVGMPAAFTGPSESVVIADRSVPPEIVAIDVVLQAEHGPDGLACLVTWEKDVADAVDFEIEKIFEASENPKELKSTLSLTGKNILVQDLEQAVTLVNEIRPEHLQLMVKDPDRVVGEVRHAGAIFCGIWSPTSLGDYIAGPSHVLPTAGTARFAGALSVRDFTKEIHIVSASSSAIKELGAHVVHLAEAEGFSFHAESIKHRLRLLSEEAEVNKGE